ncbi:GntR family transcriptional regulator, partial [Staphylococcus cohnii]
GLIEEHAEIVDELYNKNIDKAVILLESHLKKDLEFSLYYLSFRN